MEKFYNPETKILTVPDPPINLDPRGLGYVLFDCMKKNPDNIAQIDAVTGEKDLYSSYFERCVRTAMKMKSLGITSSDIISICSFNHLNNTIPFVASLLLGAKTASVDPTLSLTDIMQLMDIVKPKLVFVSVGSEKLIEDAIEELGLSTKIVVFGDSDSHFKFEDFSKYKCDVDNFEPRVVEDLEEIAFIVFSSGTTGLPKGICCSHKMALFHSDPVFPLKLTLGFASLYWISAIMFVTLAVRSGTARLVCPKFDPKIAWEYIKKYEVYILFLAPCDSISLFHTAPEKATSFPKFMLIGGSGISHNYILKIRAILPKTIVCSSYGQSELMGVFDVINDISMNRPGCVGIPLPGRSYKIVDPETEQTVGCRQEGELRIKTKYCMSGYYGQNSSSAWDSEGYLKTGDVFYFDEDFGFYIVDRIKEMFKYKSWHIVPAKLEAILAEHPDVDMGIVVGVPHPEVDNHATAVVQLNSGSEITADEILNFVNEKVDDRHKLRGGVKFVSSMPLTPTSKVKRRELVKMIVNGVI